MTRLQAARRFLYLPESHVEVFSVYQQQESRPARFCNTGGMKKTRGVGCPPGQVMGPAPSFFQTSCWP